MSFGLVMNFAIVQAATETKEFVILIVNNAFHVAHTLTANTLCIRRHVPEGAPKQTNGYLQLKGKRVNYLCD